MHAYFGFGVYVGFSLEHLLSDLEFRGSDTALGPLDLWVSASDVARTLQTRCTPASLQEFVDCLVVPCTRHLQRISSEYLTARHRHFSGQVFSYSTPLYQAEYAVLDLRAHIRSFQVMVTQFCHMGALLRSQRASPATLSHIDQMTEAFKAEVVAFMDRLQEALTTVDDLTHQHAMACAEFDRLREVEAGHQTAAEGLLRQIRDFLAPYL